ncbi:MAG: ComEC/Rec2 family competence protein [Bacillota bacterium]
MRDVLALVGLTGFALGILIASLYSVSWIFIVLTALWGIIFCGAWVGRRRVHYLFISLFVLGVFLGAVRVTLAPQTSPPAFLPLIEQKVALEGVVVADPDIRESSTRITVRVGYHNSQTDVLAVVDRYTSVTYGERVRIEGTLERPEPFDTNGGRIFRYDRFLAKDGVFLMMSPARIEILAPARGVGVRMAALLYETKHLFIRGLENALPEPESSLASGIIVGGKQGLGSKLLDVFTTSGLLPVIVLSGYNVMIVAESVLSGLSFLPRHFALGMAGMIVTLFVAAAGGGASAIRAGVMAGLALYARASGRTYSALRALAFVLVLMLLLNPLSLAYDPGFQFSFMATLGLILASSPIETQLTRVPWKWLREIIASTLAAQLFVLPLLLYQSGNLSFVSIPANILVLPVIPLAMLLSFIAGLCGMVIAPVAPYMGVPAWVLLAYVIGVAEISARLPHGSVIIPAFSFVFVILAYTFIACGVHRLAKQHKKNEPD